VYAVLVGLGTQTATLQVGKEQRVVRLASLGRLWQGDFATFWQPPPGFVPELRDGSTGPTIDTLASLLARAEALEGQTPATAVASSASGSAVHAATGQRLDAALRARVRAFQRTQGLSADGHPGPLTFMQLESALGLHTPRLLTD
jgi:general secretion pathway protein A